MSLFFPPLNVHMSPLLGLTLYSLSGALMIQLMRFMVQYLKSAGTSFEMPIHFSPLKILKIPPLLQCMHIYDLLIYFCIY